MNNGFYILPNEEGYLVKSHDTNSEIALFRSRRDAEVFISTLTLPSSFSPANAYSTAPQYVPQPQQVLTPYPSASGISPQVFFIQQPAPIQQPVQTSYPFYQMMPQVPPMGMHPGMHPSMYQNNWPQNSCGGGCTCGYNEHSEEDYYRKKSTEKKYQGNRRGDDFVKNDVEENEHQSKQNFKATWDNFRTSEIIINNNEPENNIRAQQPEEVSSQSDGQLEEYNNVQPAAALNETTLEQQTFANNEEEHHSLGQQGFPTAQQEPILPVNNTTEAANSSQQQVVLPEQQPIQNQGSPEKTTYYEQAFMTPPVYVNDAVSQSQPHSTTQFQPQQELTAQQHSTPQPQSQPQQHSTPQVNPIDLNDDDFFSFINDDDLNHYAKISKEESKRLAKEESKLAKIQVKLEKQNQKKSNRKNANDIEELDSIIE